MTNILPTYSVNIMCDSCVMPTKREGTQNAPCVFAKRVQLISVGYSGFMNECYHIVAAVRLPHADVIVGTYSIWFRSKPGETRCFSEILTQLLNYYANKTYPILVIALINRVTDKTA